VSYFSELVAGADLAILKNSVGGENLSAGMLVLLALVIYDGYLLFPGGEERAVRSLGLASPLPLRRGGL
jgi:hypothetical protein